MNVKEALEWFENAGSGPEGARNESPGWERDLAHEMAKTLLRERLAVEQAANPAVKIDQRPSRIVDESDWLELQSYREREPLVQEAIAALISIAIDADCQAEQALGERVRDFKVSG